MNNQEFETYYREQVRDLLNRLQTAMVASAQVEATLSEIGESIQRLSQDVEHFLVEQNRPGSGEDSPSAS
ncbi:MAG TPA: hypothetical protein V6D29_04380 [Leptolyngbyaceae cyanobacterium]